MSAVTGPAFVPVEHLVHSGLYEQRPPALPKNWTAPEDMRAIRLHELDLYVTMNCNIRCDFCNVRAGEYSHRDLPLPRILSLIEEACALGLEEVHFLGGEPTMRKDLEDMVVFAASLGLHTRIITNGMLLPRERLARLIDSGLGEVMISVDGLEETHNRMRQCAPDGWRKTLACVRDAISLGLRTRISAVAYEENYDEIVPLLRLTNAIGAQIFSVFLGSPLGRGREKAGAVIGPFRWRALQEEVLRESDSLRPDLEVVMEQGFAWTDLPPLDRAAIKGRGTGCNTLLDDFDYLIVRSDGNVYQCVFFMTEGRPIGNIAGQPLEETLQYALQLATYRPFTVPQDRCSSCLHQVDCGTGCRGYAHLLSGNWLKTDPRCGKREPRAADAPPWYPVCPILKRNVRSGRLGGSTEQALERSHAI